MRAEGQRRGEGEGGGKEKERKREIGRSRLVDEDIRSGPKASRSVRQAGTTLGHCTERVAVAVAVRKAGPAQTCVS